MRNSIYSLILLFCLFGLNLSATDVDRSRSAQRENQSVQSITLDPKTYREFKEDKVYDYYSTRIEKSSFIEQMKEEFNRWLKRNVNPDITKEQVNVWFWIALSLIVLFIAWVFYRYKPGFFYLNKKSKIGFQIEDEDISMLNFYDLIKDALKSGNYSEAIRLNYLQTLKALHEKELLSWDANKTVNEYVYELNRSDLKADFKVLSLQFVYYRYGNGNASEEVFVQFADLSRKITNRL